MKFVLPKFVKKLDMFGAQPPNFNIRGQKKVKTSYGACASILITTITLLFAIIKMEKLAMRKSPFVVSYTETLQGEGNFNTGGDDFMMAFAAKSVTKDKYLSDESYIKWYVRFVVKIGDVENESWERLHRCSGEEFGRFYPPSPRISKIVKTIQEGGHFYCLDW